jgi:hypothetical protein
VTTELEPLAGELAEPLAEVKARKLDERIRRMAADVRGKFETLSRLIDEAKHGQIHVALGFGSWTAYLADALGGRLELTGETRREVVQLMAGEGMSLRTIGQATGVSKGTVARDLAAIDDQVSHDETPADQADDNEAGRAATVTGLDGKEYAKQKPKAKTAGPSVFAQFSRKSAAILGATERLAEWVRAHSDDLIDRVDLTDAERSPLGLGIEHVADAGAVLNDLHLLLTPLDDED